MSEEKKGSFLQEQAKIKPAIEDVIPEYLDGDMKKSALDFVSYLRENKMTLRWAGFTNAWKANYKGKCICYVKLRAGENDKWLWVVYPYLNHIGEYENAVIEAGLQNIVWDNVFNCMGCRIPCIPTDRTILGKVCKNLCGGRQPVWFFDPDAAAIDCVKTLLEFEKKARIENSKK